MLISQTNALPMQTRPCTLRAPDPRLSLWWPMSAPSVDSALLLYRGRRHGVEVLRATWRIQTDDVSAGICRCSHKPTNAGLCLLILGTASHSYKVPKRKSNISFVAMTYRTSGITERPRPSFKSTPRSRLLPVPWLTFYGLATHLQLIV